jgi:DNA-binding response OmpR family regulator
MGPLKKKINRKFCSYNFLIVEDEPAIQLKIEADLRALGFRGNFHFRDRAEHLRESLEQLEIDFVFLDWNLKGEMTGLDGLQQVRKIKKFNSLPIIIFSVKNDVNFLLDAIKNGASDFLVKPWEKQELKRKIELTQK